jgi:hypothetical protein
VSLVGAVDNTSSGSKLKLGEKGGAAPLVFNSFVVAQKDKTLPVW